jgi:hypothetical protein
MKAQGGRSAALVASVLALVLLPLAAHAEEPEGRLYTPGPFDKLEVAGSAQLRLVQGPRDQVFIAGDAELQKDVSVELHNDRLLIRPSGSWKFWNSQRLQVDVSMRNLRQLVISGAADLRAAEPMRLQRVAIHISGAGQVRFDDVVAEQLSFGISGAGEGLLKGQVQDLNLQVTGKGKLVADHLRADQATVAISGIGHAAVWVTDELRVSVSGIGTVDYFGAPEVKRRTSGLAKVNALGEKPPR